MQCSRREFAVAYKLLQCYAQIPNFDLKRAGIEQSRIPDECSGGAEWKISRGRVLSRRWLASGPLRAAWTFLNSCWKTCRVTPASPLWRFTTGIEIVTAGLLRFLR